MKTLKDVKIGQRAVIARIHGEGALKRRMMDMGLTKGAEVYLRKAAPFGDPVEIMIRGYALTLRRDDAGMIEIL